MRIQNIENSLTVPLLLNTLWIVWIEFFDMAVTLIRLKGFAKIVVLLVLQKIRVTITARLSQRGIVIWVLIFYVLIGKLNFRCVWVVCNLNLDRIISF